MSNESEILKQRIAELESLNQLAQTLSSTLDVEKVLTTIVEAALSLCRAERAAVLLLRHSPNEEAKTLVRGASPSQGDIGHNLNLLVAGWIDRHRRPLCTADIVKELGIENPTDRMRALGSALAVPLVFGGETIGILNLVNSQHGTQFGENALRLASAVASHAVQFIHRAKLHETLFEDNQRLKSALKQAFEMRAILGQSPAVKDVLEILALAASSNATVLLVGETGTGKELAARAVHFKSSRAEKPFVAINCAAIPASLAESELFGHERGAFTGATEARKGKFEVANQGTVFLDEISEMPLDLQPKLLRVLENRVFYSVGSGVERHVDVRLIAASSRDLATAVQEGTFREDLFYRLNVLPVRLPPLRERAEDIPVLAQAFLDEFSGGTRRFADDALELLKQCKWKGNVRELRNIVERISIFVQSAEISAGALTRLGIGSERGEPSRLRSALDALVQSNRDQSNLLEAVEKDLIQLAMQKAEGKVTHAAELLGIDRNALQRRIEKYGL